MKIISLSQQQFSDFASINPLNNYMQTFKYALVMADYGYDYDFIGYVDDNEKIYAASLILTKVITGKTRYGYAPKGFLLNYYDESLLKHFLIDLRDYYKKSDFVFIKFNPEIIIGQTDKAHKYVMSYNGNVRIIDALKALGVKRRKELTEFNDIQPRFNAYINLKRFSLSTINRNYRKKIKKCINSGMTLVLDDVKSMDVLYSMLKTKRPITYYRAFYNSFDKDNSIDLVYVKVDFEKRLTFAKQKYNIEQQKNDEWNNIIQNNPTPRNLNNKISSDKKLAALKENVISATNALTQHKEAIVAGALVVKHYNRVSVVASGYSEEFKSMNPNHFLYFAILERYKSYFNFCDINGVSGVFDDKSNFKGLNDFKLKWNPTIYEFIGEFDLICSQTTFKRLIKTSFIEDEFNQHLDHDYK